MIENGYKGDSRTPLKTKKMREQIDQMVYELYGLTEGEIKIVEGK